MKTACPRTQVTINTPLPSTSSANNGTRGHGKRLAATPGTMYRKLSDDVARHRRRGAAKCEQETGDGEGPLAAAKPAGAGGQYS